LTSSVLWEVVRGQEFAKVYPNGYVEALDDYGTAEIYAIDEDSSVRGSANVAVYPTEADPDPSPGGGGGSPQQMLQSE
jgi:hypothetical protein